MAQENLENKVYKENKVAKIFTAFNVISAIGVMGVGVFYPELLQEHNDMALAAGMYFLLTAPCSMIYLYTCADRKKQAEENAKKYINTK